MQWETNSNETICNLKNSSLEICIRKLIYSNNWFLYCSSLGIHEVDLNTENFNEAVEQSQIIIMEKATKVYEFAVEFVKNVYDNNEFIKR